MQTVHVVCPHDCPDTCSMLVTVNEQGRAVRIEGNPQHPPTAGVLCTKVSRYLERTYHPERLLYPLKRIGNKGSGQFQRISWDEALETIATKLNEIRQRNPQAILPCSYGGTLGKVQQEGMAARFFNRIGAALLDRTVCASAGGAALKASMGAGVSADLEQVEHAKVILIWGSNPVVTGVHFWRRAQMAQRQGAILIAIDPHRSLTAQKCQQHIAILPGTDGALALSLLHVLIRDRLIDHAYIQAYTNGFAAFAERAQAYPPAKAADICGITAQEIENLAQLLGKTAMQDQQPVLMKLGYGMQRVRGGGNAVRAAIAIPTVLGAWRHKAGGLIMSTSGFFPFNTPALERPDLRQQPARTINLSQLGNALLQDGDDKIEALIVYNCNPVAILPDSAKVAAGFAREDLFTVVLEHFQTDSADYADIILPATTQLEHSDIHRAYGHNYIQLSQQAIRPLGECKPNSEIFRLIAARMGLTDPALQENDLSLMQQVFDWQHPHTQAMQWATLQSQGWQRLAVPDAPFAQGNFPTRSGKFEFVAAELGEYAVPDFLPPHESALNQPELAQRYPLQFISPPARHFLNSSFVNVTSLHSKTPEPTVELNPLDAALRGIESGQMVTIKNDRGSFTALTVVTDNVRQGVVVAPSIWWKKLAKDGKNCNEVASQALTDLGAAATYYDCLVEVTNA